MSQSISRERLDLSAQCVSTPRALLCCLGASANTIAACKVADTHGFVRSKLLNACVPESIDERALNVPDQPGNELPEKSAMENALLCVNAAKAQGCAMGSVAAEDIVSGKVSALA